MTKKKSLLREDYLSMSFKVSQVLAGYATARAIYSDLTHRWHERNNYWISLGFTDSIFTKIAKYITLNAVQDQTRRNVASTNDGFVFSFRVSDSVVVDIKGYHVTVFVVQEDGSGSSKKQVGFSNLMAPSYLEFKCKSKEEFEAVYKWLDEIREDHYARDTRPKIYVAGSWDDWNEYGRIPARPTDSIVLKAGQAERIIEDLTLFLDSEDDYNEAGLPYHRGYMLHGPPGTGKSSFLMALATLFNKNICFMPSSSLKAEKGITELFSYVPHNSILVLEDVDTSFAVQSRAVNDTTEVERTSLSTMLNTLDGITTPHGMILFMTTNDLTLIDEAILRPGRIDQTEEISYLDNEQLNRLVSRFMKEEFVLDTYDISDLRIVPAAISEIFKSSLRDRHSIIGKVYQLVEERKAMALDGISL